jgi:hypothetical protein
MFEEPERVKARRPMRFRCKLWGSCYRDGAGNVFDSLQRIRLGTIILSGN